LDIPSLLLFHILIVHSLEHHLIQLRRFPSLFFKFLKGISMIIYSLESMLVQIISRISGWWMKHFFFQFLLYRKPTRSRFVARAICFCRLWLQGAWQMLHPLFTNPKFILQIYWLLINTFGNYMSVRCWSFFFWVGEWQIVGEIKFSTENHW